MTDGRRRVDIQGLRAIAILLVVAFHGHFGVHGGFVGVDVFFAISGFVIASSLVAELETTGTVSLPAFYRRRVKRLLPALAVMLLFVAAVGVIATPAIATHLTAMTGIFASLFTANVYLAQVLGAYFTPSSQLDPLLHTWTLGVEEQFYLVFPLLLLMAWRLGARWGARRRVAILVLFAASVESLWLDIGAVHGDFALSAYYSSPARAWEFAAGCLVALAAPHFKRLRPAAALGLAVAGSAGIVVAGGVTASGSGLALREVLPVAATCALLAAGVVVNPLSRLLGNRVLVWIGDRSYSWYLWHWPFIVFADALVPRHSIVIPIAAICSIVPAWLSYRYVENPIRFDIRIRGFVAGRLAVACIGVPALAMLAASRVPPITFAGSTATAAKHADEVLGCNADNVPYLSKLRIPCTWIAPHSRGHVVLVGDSNAGQFSEPFVGAASELGLTATIATPASCPFSQLAMAKHGFSYAACERFNESELPDLERQRPALVVISSRLDLYLRDPVYRFGKTSASLTNDPVVKRRLLTYDLTDEVRDLERAGIPVVLITPVPVLPTSYDEDCAVLLEWLGTCGGSLPQAVVDRKLAEVRAVESVVARRPLTWLVSFESELCPGRRCLSARDGVMWYRNQYHLSVAGSERLTHAFASRVLSHARGL